MMKYLKHKTEYLLSGVFLLALVFLPQVSAAETVLRTGIDLSVESEQVVEGDYYVSSGLFGSSVMSGKVEGDMYGVGAVVTVNGEVGTDATIAAGTVHMYGPVGDDLRVLAGEVTIAEPVAGDLFVLGGLVSILSTASIGGDVFVFGGAVSIEGDVQGSVYGHAEQVSINAAVGKNVEVTAPAGFSLGDKASIAGDVRYTSAVPISRTPGAVVEGELLQGKNEEITPRDEARAILIPLFIALFTVLSLYLLFKQQIVKLVELVQGDSGKSMLIGALVLVAGPVAAVVLMMTVLGVFVGMALFAFLIMLYVVSMSLTGAVLGLLLSRLVTPNAQLSLGTIMLGTLLLHGLMFIPVVGIFLLIVLLCVTLGGICILLYRAFT